MADISTIKDKISTELGNISEIAGHEQLQFTKPSFDLDVGSYPHVILSPPSIQSEVLDNRNVIRTYNFELFVFFKHENLEAGSNDIENTIEAIMNHFDNLTDDLDGNADGGIRPAATAPEIVNDSSNKTFAMVTVILEVRATQSLTF